MLTLMKNECHYVASFVWHAITPIINFDMIAIITMVYLIPSFGLPSPSIITSSILTSDAISHSHYHPFNGYHL